MKAHFQIKHKVILTILDGWGIGDGSKSDAIETANTIYLDKLFANNPHSQLLTSGEEVGLPDGQMGNSEVGHLNIGSGRVVFQDLVRINNEIKSGAFFQNQILNEAITKAKNANKKLHLIGLVSDGGVHSSQEHLHALCDLAKAQNFDKLMIHAITDGRDTDPKSGLEFIKKLEQHLEHSAGKLASVIGRYYAMDRDKRWERIKIAYDLYINGKGESTNNFSKSIEDSYQNQVTDEFLKPIYNPQIDGKIESGDVVLCFNYRTDRLRQLTTVLTQKEFPEFDMHTIPLEYYTLTNYDDTFNHVNVVYDKDNLEDTLGAVVSGKGLKQLRIAETEKYAHVTFFFSGGREAVFPGEERILVPSPKVATYDLQPEMSADEVGDNLLHAIESKTFDLIVVNFANGDMVGHTGVYPAIIHAIETVDQIVGKVAKSAKYNDYQLIIIADHGNSDFVINADGSPNTAHSLNPVPFLLISDEYREVKNGRLADVAPTILDLMGIKQPKAMTGTSLIVR